MRSNDPDGLIVELTDLARRLAGDHTPNNGLRHGGIEA
jgi:hypothetical protein